MKIGNQISSIILISEILQHCK